MPLPKKTKMFLVVVAALFALYFLGGLVLLLVRGVPVP